MLATRITGALLLAGLITGLQVSPLRAQDSEGGLELTFDIRTGVNAHSNLRLSPFDPGPTYRSDTDLTFGLSSETRNQRLELTLGSVLRFEDGPFFFDTKDGEIVNSQAALSYSREMVRSEFTLDADYRETDLSDSEFDEDLGTSSLNNSRGDRLDFSWESSLALGTAGPFGVTFTLGQRFVEYENTIDPDLFDRDTTTGTIDFALTLSPVLTGTAQIFASEYEAEDNNNTERDQRAFSLGAIYTPDPRTEINATLGAREIDDSVDGKTDGMEAALGYTRALPRGSFSLLGEIEQTTAGQRNQMEISRLFEFPLAEFEAALGLSYTDGADTEPVFWLRYNRELARGELSASLSRDVSVNNDAESQGVTRAAVDYLHRLTQLTQLNIGLDFVDVADISNSGFTERQRGSLTATLNREITPDWGLSAGVSRRYLDENGITRWDSSIFATVQRSFSVRP